MLPTLSLEKGALETKKHIDKKCSVVGKPGSAKKHKKLLLRVIKWCVYYPLSTNSLLLLENASNFATH